MSLNLSQETKAFIEETVSTYDVHSEILESNKQTGIGYCRHNFEAIKFMVVQLYESPEIFRDMTPDGFRKLCQWAAQHLAECLVVVGRERGLIE